MVRRLVLSAALAVPALVVLAPPAAADHTHFRVLGNGQCVLLAAAGGEKHVQLPHAEELPANRRHPLHVNVHLGRPGQSGAIHVAYTADGTLTPAATSMCGGSFVNARP